MAAIVLDVVSMQLGDEQVEWATVDLRRYLERLTRLTGGIDVGRRDDALCCRIALRGVGS